MAIDQTAKIYPNVKIGKGSGIGEFSVIGKPSAPVKNKQFGSKTETNIGQNCYIGSHVIIGQGTVIGDNSIIEDGSKVDVDCKLGLRSHLLYRAYVDNNSVIADDCIIGGFVCERSLIGKSSRIFGKLIHKHNDPTLGWDDSIEGSPVVMENVVIGFDALVIGPVKIGHQSYICAGATVTKNVPSNSIVYGVNKIVSHKDWKGYLSKSSFFK